MVKKKENQDDMMITKQCDQKSDWLRYKFVVSLQRTFYKASEELKEAQCTIWSTLNVNKRFICKGKNECFDAKKTKERQKDKKIKQAS